MELFPIDGHYGKGLSFARRINESEEFLGRMTTTEHDCGILAQVVANCEYPSVGIELGVLFGGSTIVIARAFKEFHGVAPVFGVDVFDISVISTRDAEYPKVPVTPDTVIKNASLFGVGEQVVLFPDHTYPLPAELMGLEHKVGLVHVDAGKDYSSVRSDLFTARRLEPEYIVVNGYNRKNPGLLRAVKEHTLHNHYYNVHTSGNLIVFMKMKGLDDEL